jgi:Flp pilus assembly protein TadG
VSRRPLSACVRAGVGVRSRLLGRTGEGRTGEGRRSGGGSRAADGGNAMIEFVFLAVLLLYVLLTVFQVQRAAYAANAATREAGRAFATADSDAEGYARAYAAAAVALADHGMTLAAGQPAIGCSAQPCLTPGATLDVALDTEIPLPFLPRVLDGRAPASIGVSARHVAYVDEYRRAGP